MLTAQLQLLESEIRTRLEKEKKEENRSQTRRLSRTGPRQVRWMETKLGDNLAIKLIV